MTWTFWLAVLLTVFSLLLIGRDFRRRNDAVRLDDAVRMSLLLLPWWFGICTALHAALLAMRAAVR